MKKIKRIFFSILTVVTLLAGMLPVGLRKVEAGSSYPAIQLQVPYYPQKIKDDCGISSIAMIEAYALGYDKNKFDTVYSSVLAANGNSLSIDSACSNGKYRDIPINLESFYEELAAGNPILIYRKPYNHWSVIVGYNGSSSQLQQSGFIVWDTKRWDGQLDVPLNWDEMIYDQVGRRFDLSRWLKAPTYKNNTYVDQGSTNLVNAKVRVTGAIGDGVNTSIFSSVYADGISPTDATIHADLTSVVYSSDAGFYISTNADMSSSQRINESVNGSFKTIFYNMNKWYGTLAQGTTYYYQFYIVAGGKETKSDVYNFTTSGAIDSVFPLVDGGTYKICSVLSGQVMEVSSGSSANSKQINLWPYDGATWMQWHAIQHQDGYSFVNVATGKALHIADASAAAGAKVTQYDYNASTAQRFKLVDQGNDRYGMLAICSGLAVDVWGSLTENGAKLEQYAFHGGNNQLWSFELIDTESPKISAIHATDINSDGYTVVCTVTDNTGVARVCFPTWTEANNQDDLDNNWYNTMVGNSLGNDTYSFRVNTATHNNERGIYITHIYAYDAYGNYSSDGINVNVPLYIPFTDVAQDAWYHDAVAGVYEKGYMSGKGNGIFSPEGLLTRGEIATVLYNMSGKPSTSYSNHFHDIPQGQWYSNPVSWVYRSGIAAGYGNGNFGVGDRLTREQLAVMLYQYAQYNGNDLSYNNNALSGFPDAGQVSSWAITAMKWAVSKQIINGTGDGYLRPDGNATRAECASVINGYAEKVQ